MAQGVAHQDVDDLAQAEIVADQLVGHGRVHLEAQEEPLEGCGHSVGPVQGVHEPAQGKAAQDRFQGPGLDAGQLQQIVHDLGEPVCGFAGDFPVFPLFGGKLLGQGQLHHAHDAVDGRAQFVAHVGQKLGLGLVGGIGQPLGPVQFVLFALAHDGQAEQHGHAGHGAHLVLAIAPRGVGQGDLSQDAALRHHGDAHEVLQGHMPGGQSPKGRMAGRIVHHQGRAGIEGHPPQAGVRSIGIRRKFGLHLAGRQPALAFEHVRQGQAGQVAGFFVDEPDKAVPAAGDLPGDAEHDVRQGLEGGPAAQKRPGDGGHGHVGRQFAVQPSLGGLALGDVLGRKEQARDGPGRVAQDRVVEQKDAQAAVAAQHLVLVGLPGIPRTGEGRSQKPADGRAGLFGDAGLDPVLAEKLAFIEIAEDFQSFAIDQRDAAAGVQPDHEHCRDIQVTPGLFPLPGQVHLGPFPLFQGPQIAQAMGHVPGQLLKQGDLVVPEGPGSQGVDAQHAEGGAVLAAKRQGHHGQRPVMPDVLPPGRHVRVGHGVCHDHGAVFPDCPAHGPPAVRLPAVPHDFKSPHGLQADSGAGQGQDRFGRIVLGHTHPGGVVAADLHDGPAHVAEKFLLAFGPHQHVVAGA
ncbi:hypothetical protein ASZ90_001528 [hydrocarbon metagenome]|uniref:Uncharacterized protein n=1 Tax=hydrocarbon metagenome TaxID=938273 RepID=A0A0W8G633_9ZZZZ